MAENQTRLREKLVEQIGFLTRSATAFDAGEESEAFRIAVCLRVLFHDTKHSMSLFKHLGKSGTDLLSSSRIHKDWKDFLRTELNINSTTPISYSPILGTGFGTLRMSDWWGKERVFAYEGIAFYRRNIVLSMANKDGGAHVDEQLESYYRYLVDGLHGFGINGNLEYDGPSPFPQGVTVYGKNGHLALMRQFAHEVLCSSRHFGWLA